MMAFRDMEDGSPDLMLTAVTYCLHNKTLIRLKDFTLTERKHPTALYIIYIFEAAMYYIALR